MSTNERTVEAVITGEVQGVFFRQWTSDQARSLGLSGWVRNDKDGSVRAHFSGRAEAVGTMIERLRRGPPASKVDDLQVEESDPEPENEGFRILR
jgi:acylphosphatase